MLEFVTLRSEFCDTYFCVCDTHFRDLGGGEKGGKKLQFFATTDRQNRHDQLKSADFHMWIGIPC